LRRKREQIRANQRDALVCMILFESVQKLGRRPRRPACAFGGGAGLAW
jgi:hypothetical protein